MLKWQKIFQRYSNGPMDNFVCGPQASVSSLYISYRLISFLLLTEDDISPRGRRNSPLTTVIAGVQCHHHHGRRRRRRHKGGWEREMPADTWRVCWQRTNRLLLRESRLGGQREGARPDLSDRGRGPAWLVAGAPHRQVPLLQPQPGLAHHRPAGVHHLPLRLPGRSKSHQAGLGV